MKRAGPVAKGPSDATSRQARGALMVLLGAAALVAGCASSGPSGRVDIDPDAPGDTLAATRESQAVAIEVSNDLTPPTSAVVFVELGGGARYRLGRVQPGHTETFRFRPQVETRRIRLLGETNQGAIVRSGTFTVSQAARVRWRMHY